MKYPALYKAPTKAFNTYLTTQIDGTALTCPEDGILISAGNLGTFLEEQYIYQIQLELVCVNKFVGELAAFINLVPDYISTQVAKLSAHLRGVCVIPLGADEFTSHPYLETMLFDFRGDLMIHVDKDDQIQLWSTGQQYENGGIGDLVGGAVAIIRSLAKG